MASASLGPSLVDMEYAGTLQYPDDTEDVFLPCHKVQGTYFTQTTMLTEYKNIWFVQKDDTIGCGIPLISTGASLLLKCFGRATVTHFHFSTKLFVRTSPTVKIGLHINGSIFRVDPRSHGF